MTGALNGGTRLFPIIGDPIVYVKSPERLTRSFADRNMNAICIPMQVAEERLGDVMQGLSAIGNIDGLLVTMPHKAAAFGYRTTYSERARLLKVVSVMRRNPDGSWHGDMLDGLAFVKAQIDQGADPGGARALLVGAGGAGSAIAIALLEAGVGELVIHDSHKACAEELLATGASLGRGKVRLGPPNPTGCDLVFNATPMGMTKSDAFPVDVALLDASMFVGDVIAGHGTTPFLRAAQAAGCRTANGDQMVEAVQDMMVEFMLAR
ncbi:shikimate dehydrogenase [Rhizobium sp. XQZ8]|uniref:shikimate dehydrogenase family protein n=1 Tax=Rhizobium populisoli TaxID=2859785 RepID=UPI001CA56000|nr:shikimate dehydrogenase [Rhizobium populisoli]MBW6421094.1 shikimate dehydrogenase [Rhizobium populisoli]